MGWGLGWICEPIGDGEAEVAKWDALIHQAVEVSPHVGWAYAEEVVVVQVGAVEVGRRQAGEGGRVRGQAGRRGRIGQTGHSGEGRGESEVATASEGP